MDKLKIDQICILCTKTIADGRIAEFFANRGIEQSYVGRAVGKYYHSNGEMMLVSNEIPEGKIKINPWKRTNKKFPREMMVSNDNNHWLRRLVYGKIKYEKPYVAAPAIDIAKVLCWKYAKEIDQEEKITLDSIEDLKDLKIRINKEIEKNKAELASKA